ncbi:MAG: hypothetical protein AB8B52_07470 [Winogradskyella sp.]|uniref:hypothetical protein n=1 Tax=Winogradskyella sp. TaxID=1883156 RepID=UPI003859E3FD
MKRLGIYLALFGIAAIVLPYFERQLFILSWIDNWGTFVSWVIKIGLVIVGGLVFFSSQLKSKKVDVSQNDTDL